MGGREGGLKEGRVFERRPGGPQMVDEGFQVDSVDYDGRTALMLASASGHVAVVKLLLQHGADPTREDGLGRCAILEACTHDHDAVIDVLRIAGARYIAPPSPSFSLLDQP